MDEDDLELSEEEEELARENEEETPNEDLDEI